MPEYSERFFRSGTLRILGARPMVHFDRPQELVTAMRHVLLADTNAA